MFIYFILPSLVFLGIGLLFFIQRLIKLNRLHKKVNAESYFLDLILKKEHVKAFEGCDSGALLLERGQDELWKAGHQYKQALSSNQDILTPAAKIVNIVHFLIIAAEEAPKIYRESEGK